MKRSKKYPKSTGAWMAERGWADLTGCPRYVRDAVLAAGIPTRWRARLFAPAWVLRVYRVVEDAFGETGSSDRPLARNQFAEILRAIQKDPDAFDPEAALAAYRLGGKSALLAVLGAS